KVKKLTMSFEDVFEALDLAKPVYAFTTEKGLTGITLNIKDAEKLLKAIDSYGFESEEQNGLKWVANKSSVGCIDKDKILLCDASTSAGQDVLREEMAKLMSQGRKDVEALNNVNKQDGVFRLSAPLKGIPEEYTKNLPQGISDAILNAGLQIGKKDISLSANLTTDFSSLPLAPIQGSLANIGPEEPFLWVCFNLNGEALLPLLRDVPQIRSLLLALNLNVDADMMLKAINGDVAIAVPKLDLQNPDFILTASLANTDFLKNANDWKGVTKRGTNDFIFNYDGAKAFFGVQDNKLYISTSERIASKAFEAAPKDAFQSAAKGKYLSASLNVGQVIKSYPGLALILRTMPKVGEITDAFERVSLTADSPKSIELSVETKKPVKDIVSTLMELVAGE
ncbi:MAG: DUF4836 family protein, partial [Bacteroidaceae bacterium]|nr:DUF4836 family protein [Bacteroidaceae bacterium]